jgi:hypothetical protein
MNPVETKSSLKFHWGHIHTPNMVSEMGIILSSIPLLYGQNEVTERERR